MQGHFFWRIDRCLFHGTLHSPYTTYGNRRRGLRYASNLSHGLPTSRRSESALQTCRSLSDTAPPNPRDTDRRPSTANERLLTSPDP